MSFRLNFPYLNNTHQCPTSNLYHSNHWHNDNHCHDSGTNWHHHLGSHFLDNFPRIWSFFFVFFFWSFYLREFYIVRSTGRPSFKLESDTVQGRQPVAIWGRGVYIPSVRGRDYVKRGQYSLSWHSLTSIEQSFPVQPFLQEQIGSPLIGEVSQLAPSWHGLLVHASSKWQRRPT